MAVISPPSYLQAGTYTANMDRRMLMSLTGGRAGVIPRTATFTDLKVSQRGAGANMSVDVAEGSCVVLGTEATYQGAYYAESQGTVNITISAADATNPRRDMIVARVKDAAYSGASNTFSLEVVNGTAAASPVDPTIPANCIVLGRVAVAANATSITNANITDLRNGYAAVTGSAVIGNQVKAAGPGGVTVCTSSFRPTVSLYEGMLIFETDTNRMLRYSGSAWLVVSGTLTTGITSIAAATSYTAAGVSLSVPPGNWVLNARCEYGNTGGLAVMNPFFQIWDNTASAELDYNELYQATAEIWRGVLVCFATLSSTTTKTIQVRAKTTAGLGQVFSNTILMATATSAIG